MLAEIWRSPFSSSHPTTLTVVEKGLAVAGMYEKHADSLDLLKMEPISK